MDRKVTVIIVAAGSGTRFGATLPKQFCMLEGRPLLMTTVDRVREAMPESDIILVLNKDAVGMWRDMCDESGFCSPRIIAGGATRWESVKNALEETADEGYVMVHDGARPLLVTDVAVRLLKALDDGHQGAIPTVPVVDSLRCKDCGGDGSIAVDRSRYVAVQTPQAFPVKLLKMAYRATFSPEYTDDASVMQNAGFKDIVLVEGSPSMFKITHPLDMEIASLYLRNNDL